MADEKTKSIRVSEETHQELVSRKYGDESFDDVLQRELGLVPRTIEELTSTLPSRLATATNEIVTDYVNKQAQFKRIYDEGKGYQALQFVSPHTERVIYDVTVYYPNPELERVNHRVDIRFRNPKNTLERIAQFRDTEEGAIDIEYTDFETRETNPTTRKGKAPGEAAAKTAGQHTSKFVDLALDRWGQ
jgi:predicted CopG family antitoxin